MRLLQPVELKPAVSKERSGDQTGLAAAKVLIAEDLESDQIRTNTLRLNHVQDVA